MQFKKQIFFLSFAEPPVTRFSTRRKSVFAETYNPEDDEEDEGPPVNIFVLSYH